MDLITSYKQEEILQMMQSALVESLKELNLTPKDEDRFVTRTVAAQICDVTPQTIHLRVSKGFYKTKRVGRHVLISLNDILSSITEETLQKAKENGLID